MKARTINDIAKDMCEGTQLDAREISTLFKKFVERVRDEVADGRDVQLRGLCTFRWRSQGPHARTTPDGTCYQVPARKKLKVNLSTRFKPTKGGIPMSDNDEGMDKYGVQMDDEKVKQASETKAGTCPVCGAALDGAGACPMHGTEPFERSPE